MRKHFFNWKPKLYRTVFLGREKCPLPFCKFKEIKQKNYPQTLLSQCIQVPYFSGVLFSNISFPSRISGGNRKMKLCAQIADVIETPRTLNIHSYLSLHSFVELLLGRSYLQRYICIIKLVEVLRMTLGVNVVL